MFEITRTFFFFFKKNTSTDKVIKIVIKIDRIIILIFKKMTFRIEVSVATKSTTHQVHVSLPCERKDTCT